MHRLCLYAIISFFLIFGSHHSFASDSTNAFIDSLRIELINETNDSDKVDLYEALSEQYREIDFEESLKYSELGLDLAIGTGNRQGILDNKLDLAHIYLAYVLDYSQSAKYYNECVELARELGDKESLISIYRGLSYLYMTSEDFDQAKAYNEKAMEIAVELDRYPEISQLNAYMGELYEMTEDTANAITYYEKVLDIEQKNNFTETANVSMIVIAHYYDLIDDMEQSLKYYRIALTRFQRIKDMRWTSYTHSEMARVYISLGNYERAEQHALEGLFIAKTFKLRKELGDNYNILSVVYDSLGQTDKSAEYLNAYNALQDSLVPIETAIDIAEPVVEREETSVAEEGMNPFLQAIIITLPVILLLLFMGMPDRKS